MGVLIRRRRDTVRVDALHPRRVVLGLTGCSMLLVGLLVASLAVGSRDIPVADVLRVLSAPDGSRESIIIWQLRVPRTGYAVLVGAALGVAGAIMQVITRNPLAEPGVLGVNAGAALAVVISISVFGVHTLVGYLWWACAGAAIAVVVVALLGLRSSGQEPTRLVLAGVALSASLSAVVGIVTMFDDDTFDSYRYWVVGSLAGGDPDQLGLLAVIVAVAALGAWLCGGHFNALALGDEVGAGLGARVGSLRAVGLVLISVLCGAATAAAGPIGFVGLVVPHAIRLMVGVDQRVVLAFAMLVGPILLLASDVIGRVVARPGELEAGIVTAFIGAPVLLALVMRSRTGIRR